MLDDRRTTQLREAKARQREREAIGVDLYWLALPTAPLIDLLEAEGRLPRGRIHSHREVEGALLKRQLQEICHR